MTAVIASSTAMTAVIASSTAMTAVIASSTAMTAVIASSTAMTAVAASSTAMTAVAASSTAMTAVAASSTAMTAVAANATAMTAVIASSTAMTAVIASSTAMTAVAASSTAMTAVAASSTAMTAVAASSTAMTAVIASSTAITAIIANGTAWTTFKSSTALTAKTVPNMSSATAPSGVVSGFTPSYGELWQLFCGTNTRVFLNATSGVVGYDFGSAVYIHTTTAKNASQSWNITAMQIESSDNNSTWTVASATNLTNSGGVTNTYDVTGYGKHRYWRFNITNTNGYIDFEKLQFTGFA